MPVQRLYGYVRGFDRRLWVLSLGWFVSAMGFAVSIPFIAIYFHSKLGLSATQIGLFFGAMAVVRSAFQILGGEVSDRVERRAMLITCQYIRAATFALLALAVYGRWGLWAVAAILLVNSIFGALFQPTANAVVADVLPAAQRMDGYAITRSAMNFGWAAGPALGGFLAERSFGLLFLISAVITAVSGLVMAFFLQAPPRASVSGAIRLKDLVAVKDDPLLARHCLLTFCIYLVHSQLIAPLSFYAVEMRAVSSSGLGLLYTLNGLIVVSIQIPVTRLLAGWRLTDQMAAAALLYAVGYTLTGLCSRLPHFIPVVVLISVAEVVMSPAALTLVSRLAPENRMGRYMGIFGFFVSAGWSCGPLYGGAILDRLPAQPLLAWGLIGTGALLSGIGYLVFTRSFPAHLNR